MSVVFFTYAFPPLKYPRSIQIYRLVKHSRHAIRVICCSDASAKDETIDEGIPGKPAQRFTFPKRGGAHGALSFLTARLGLPDGERSWALGTARKALASRLITKEDVLVTFGQPMSDHLAGLVIKEKLGIPWIAHFSDPWADSPYRRALPLLHGINRRMEARVIARADQAVFTSQETADLVMAKYDNAWRSKASVLPHAFDASLYGSENGTGRVDGGEIAGNDAHHGGDGEIVIRHIGNFYGTRSPAAMLRALSELHRRRPSLLRNSRFELVGIPSRRIDIDEALSSLPPGFVQVRGPVDYLTSLRLMRESDLLVVIDAPFEKSVFLPSKLIDYIGAGAPILAITPPGTTARLVRRLGGFVARPGSEQEIRDQFTRALAVARKGDNAPFGNASVAAGYSAQSVTANFDDMIDKLRDRMKA